MKKSFKFLSIFTILLFVAGCGPQSIQPIKSLSSIQVKDIQVSDVNVSLSPEFVAGVDARIAKEQDKIAKEQDKIDNPGKRSKRKQREVAKLAKQKIEKSEKKIKRIQEEMDAIVPDVRKVVLETLENKFAGNRKVNVDLKINSFSLTSGGAVLMVGGSDSMTGVLSITDSQSNEELGLYHITDIDTNAAGGLLGLMVRGSDPRGDMIEQFSQKVYDALSGSHSD